ncbi:hypothetical protein [Conexibacter sp. W3-3-2]|uniref:hypothetical protein n=1 Tax=Conexibacter sp. W3-3-2 TaxID=2675227 RepID=UPI0035C87FDD
MGGEDHPVGAGDPQRATAGVELDRGGRHGRTLSPRQQGLLREQWTAEEVDLRLTAAMRRACDEVRERAARADRPLRDAAFDLALERLLEAARLRGRPLR